MPHPIAGDTKDTVTVVTQATGPNTAICRERARHDALLEAQNLVGMLDRMNTQR